MNEEKESSNGRTVRTTKASTLRNEAESIRNRGSPKNIRFLSATECQASEKPDSVDYDANANNLTMDDIIKKYYKFSQAMNDPGRKGSLEWFQRELKRVCFNSANTADKKAAEVMLKVHEKLFQPMEKGKKEKSDETSMPDNEALYWMGRRSLPEITEKEVEEAVEKLTPFERTKLSDEFNAMQHDGFVLIEDEKILSDVIGKSKKNVDAVLTSSESKEEYEGYEVPIDKTETYEGNSMIFGNNVLELTYDVTQWPMYEDDRSVVPLASDFGNANNMGADPFKALKESDSEKEKEKETSSPPAAVDLESPAPAPAPTPTPTTTPPPPEVTRTMELNAFIRNRVRMMLIANRVTMSYEQEVKEAILNLEIEHTQDREKALQRLIESQNQALLTAVQVASAIPLMERRLIAKDVSDPYNRQQWQRNESVTCCQSCHRAFTLITTRHHCRRCGIIYCHHCSSHAGVLPDRKGQTQTCTSPWNRLCDRCYDICCVHRRRVNESTEVPRAGYERDGRAPKDPILTVLASCPDSDKMTLEDGLPPFYVVLPEEWFALSTITFSGWVNALKLSPYKVVESLHDSTTSLASKAISKLYQWLSGVTPSVEDRDNRW
ncbi:putative zinc finger protein [Trypanosoma theileri]|uniref:Putative zinc finger protein n=1 Tax=Trypanosoma theileri TaxID=67003 RepID=A0A1X0NS41_9TRYP|nr:putative zinc finger protein [Trypanosoma theileri]ORC87368.1 putative zinc finger protein [Trypanosoma theileri]